MVLNVAIRLKLLGLLLGTICVLTLVGCGRDRDFPKPGKEPNSGIYGTVYVRWIGGPTPDPTAKPEPTPKQIAKGRLVRILDGAGKLLVELKTNEDGNFKVALEPGDYTVDLGPDRVMKGISRKDVRVEPGEYSECNLEVHNFG